MKQDKQAGEIVVFRFPQTDLDKDKLRSALLLAKLLVLLICKNNFM